MARNRPASERVLTSPTLDPTCDVLSFDSFYLREMPSLVLLAHALAGPANAEDIAQDAMLTAYRHWNEVSDYASPVGWVRRVCANRSLSALRRRGVEARALFRVGAPAPQVDQPTAEVEEFWVEVRQLPRRQAQSIALYYLYDLPVTEIAETLECSVGSVKVHLSRGRATLARRFSEDDEGSAE